MRLNFSIVSMAVLRKGAGSDSRTIIKNYSKLEGATELKCASFCSSFRALSDDILSQKTNFSDSGLKHWTVVRRFDQISFRLNNSSLEGATKLKFASFCSSFRALSDDKGVSFLPPPHTHTPSPPLTPITTHSLADFVGVSGDLKDLDYGRH